MFLFFYHLGQRDLWSSHEGRAGQNAQSILSTGQWGLPQLRDGQFEMQKPPLYYWLAAVAAWVQGDTVDAWAVRQPSAVAAWAGVLFMYFFLWLCGRPVAAWVSAFLLATSVQYTWLARVGRIDMPLTLTVSLAIGCFYLAAQQEDTRRRSMLRLIGYLAVAAGLMLKGPIGAVLPIVVLLTYSLFRSPLFALRSPLFALRSSLSAHLLWGVPLVLALTLPWFIWANIHTNGEFFHVFFWHHNLERGLGGAEVMRARPWWLYGPYLVRNFLPWSPLLVAAVWYYFRRGEGVPLTPNPAPPRGEGDNEARLGLVWLLSIFVFLSCMSFKRSDYLLPALPGAALFVGCTAEKWWLARRQAFGAPARRMRLMGVGLLSVSLVIALSWMVFVDRVLPCYESQREQRSFAATIREHAPEPQFILFFRAEAHDLAFHLGGIQNTFLEWENLDTWAGRPGTHYIVMPPDCAAEWPQHVTSGKLEEVVRNTDLSGEHEQPLVLMRTVWKE